MNGFEFAQSVRGSGAWQETPIVALSSRTTPADLDRGRSVGFADYVAKLDRHALLQSLSQTLIAS
jgi:two-component system chemotaxis sensor kinase CheA